MKLGDKYFYVCASPTVIGNENTLAVTDKIWDNDCRDILNACLGNIFLEPDEALSHRKDVSARALDIYKNEEFQKWRIFLKLLLKA